MLLNHSLIDIPVICEKKVGSEIKKGMSFIEKFLILNLQHCGRRLAGLG